MTTVIRRISTVALLSAVLGLGLAGPGCGDDDDNGENNEVEGGRLDQVDGMDVLYLWGTREEMGYAEGALLCGRVRDMFRDYVLDYVVPGSGYEYGVLKAMIGVAYEIPADDDRELRALVLGMQENCDPEDLIVESDNLEDAANGRRELTYDDLVVAHALADWACSSLTVWGDASVTGDTLHARNLDFLLDPAGVILDQHIVKVYRSDDDGGARWASVSFPGLIGCISCFNEEGTGITMHNVEALDSTNGAAPRMLAARAALVASVGAEDRVAAAEAVLDSLPQQVGNNLHFPMACTDASCVGAVVFEYDGMADHDDGFATVRASGDATGGGLDTTQALVVTNHYLLRSQETGYQNSVDRYDAVADGVNASLPTGGLDVAGALALMQEASVLGGTPTVHTVIMDTSDMTLRLYVAESETTEAPSTTPYVLDLNALFTAFPE